MTTTELIEKLQNDPVLAQKALTGMPANKKYLLTRKYGIIVDDLFDPSLIIRLNNLTEARQYQLINSALLWLRNPMRVHLIQAHLKQQQRQKLWYYRLWQQIVGHTAKIIGPILQKQAKDIAKN